METRNWKAVETTGDFAGNDRKLTVTGEVYVNGGNVEPILNAADPQGINAAILLLDLTTETTGEIGHRAFVWKPVSYTRTVELREFNQVDIRDVALIDVEHHPS